MAWSEDELPMYGANVGAKNLPIKIIGIIQDTNYSRGPSRTWLVEIGSRKKVDEDFQDSTEMDLRPLYWVKVWQFDLFNYIE